MISLQETFIRKFKIRLFAFLKKIKKGIFFLIIPKTHQMSKKLSLRNLLKDLVDEKKYQ